MLNHPKLIPQFDNKNTFFDHFGQDKPTKIGSWLMTQEAKKILDFVLTCRYNNFRFKNVRGENVI